MPTAGTRPNGPQAVAPYNYPQGEVDEYDHEWIYRHARVTDNTPTPNAVHTLEVIDGKGGLPIRGQPSKIDIRVSGIVQYHTSFTLRFQRNHGETGPYRAIQPTLDLPPGPGQPHTMAQ